METVKIEPREITAHQVSRILEVSFNDGMIFKLPYEYLRVYTPSAEATGHGPGQEILQVNKEDVTITEVKPIGNYAIAPVFSDGHTTGIYTWDFLYQLGVEQERLWADYLRKLAEQGYQRQDITHH
ncbi:MAG: DUF971 domain-containing protein [Methylococcaceae bacterium]